MANSALLGPLRSAKQKILRVKPNSGALYTKVWRMKRKMMEVEDGEEEAEVHGVNH